LWRHPKTRENTRDLEANHGQNYPGTESGIKSTIPRKPREFLEACQKEKGKYGKGKFRYNTKGNET